LNPAGLGGEVNRGIQIRDRSRCCERELLTPHFHNKKCIEIYNPATGLVLKANHANCFHDLTKDNVFFRFFVLVMRVIAKE
jgi:hypothetical protein